MKTRKNRKLKEKRIWKDPDFSENCIKKEELRLGADSQGTDINDGTGGTSINQL